MSTHEPFTIAHARPFTAGRYLDASHVRVQDGRIAAIGDASIERVGDARVDAGGATLLPGLIDAHVHLLPGCAQLAALFGVTTVVDMFSKPEVIGPERALVAASERGEGPAAADVRTSGIGATAPGGHPTLAYAPFPSVTGPGDAESFVAGRVAEGADHLKVIYDDGSGAMLHIPSLSIETIEALVAAAHRRGLVVAAHVSTAAGAVAVAGAGVDVLAHDPMDRMTDEQVRRIADAGVAVIATLALADGFPGDDGTMPLLTDPRLAGRLPARWRRTVERQATRWLPPRGDARAPYDNVAALHAAGVPILAGTDAPNPGLVHGASLHRELGHLVEAGLTPAEALAAATDVPARVFGLGDRGVLEVGARADLLLVAGDPARDAGATSAIIDVWARGRRLAAAAYPGSAAERDGVAWLRESTARILQGIRDTWPGMPGPEDVLRADGELLGRVVPQPEGWQPVTSFGAPLGGAAGHDEAVAVVRERGLAALAEPWWVRAEDSEEWREARILEVAPGRLRARWRDPLVEQPANGVWLDLGEVDVAARPGG